MYIQQLYTSCLSQATYYIESNGEAVIIDPLRDIDVYLELAKERKSNIKYIFETHFHADFVSGHLDLAKATGAPIIYGPGTETKLPVQIAADGETFKLGELTIEVLHTPGHTLESSCYLLKDASGKDHCVFTGDTLFVGDVGRPDLAQKENEITTQDLAGMLYRSLQAKIVPLADDVIVYPAHGPGSACGKNLRAETFSTIGNEKQYNYALKAYSKEEFIKVVTEGLTAPPQYFPINARINKEGYASLDEVLSHGLTALSIDGLKKLMEKDVLILDSRPAKVFTKGFVPGSISIGLEGRFAEWAGSLLSFEKPMVLITDPGKAKETVTRLARVGFDKIKGYLDGGFDAWKKAGEQIDMIIDVEVDAVAIDLLFDNKMVILDVRTATEFADGHIQQAVNLPLNELVDPASMANIEKEQNLYIHCAGGYRSVIAASMLKQQGIHNLRNVLNGWSKIKEMEDKFKIVKEKASLN